MTTVIKILMAVVWLAFAAGTMEALVDLTKQVGYSAADAHRKGPISYGRFSRLLTDTK